MNKFSNPIALNCSGIKKKKKFLHFDLFIRINHSLDTLQWKKTLI